MQLTGRFPGRFPGRFITLALAAVVLAGCTGLFFQPMRQHILSPDQLGLKWRDVWLDTADGVRLHAWFLPAARPGFTVARGTVLFLHGNAENISTHIGSVGWMPAEGLNVLLPDYRGYGLSEGAPSLAGLHRDAEAALAAVFALPEVDADRVVVFGQSLGGSVAISALAASPQRDEVRALIVEGAFSGYRRIARDVLARAWLTWPFQWPLSFLVDDRFRPADDIARIAPVPVLIIVDEGDQVVPPEHAQELYAAAAEPKALWMVADAGHIAALQRPAQRRRLIDYLEACAFAPATAPSACTVAPRRR